MFSNQLEHGKRHWRNRSSSRGDFIEAKLMLAEVFYRYASGGESTGTIDKKMTNP
jgi:hypothetical protein